MLVSNIKVHVEFNKSSSFRSTGVGYIIRLGYESVTISRYIGNFQVNFFRYTGSTKFLPKFWQSLPYTRGSQVIYKIILHFQF
jgi:hypothetical protein